nr:hypothetical protein [Tanacetum cinerariifolium]
QILLLDEPTNHLDIQQQLSILGRVHQLPVTTVIALHDLNQALDCDRLAILDGGRLVALGSPFETALPNSPIGPPARWRSHDRHRCTADKPRGYTVASSLRMAPRRSSKKALSPAIRDDAFGTAASSLPAASMNQ